MKEFQDKVKKIPRNIRFIIIAIIAVMFNLPLAVLLVWIIYPEWSRKTKIVLTMVLLTIIAVEMSKYMSYSVLPY